MSAGTAACAAGLPWASFPRPWWLIDVVLVLYMNESRCVERWTDSHSRSLARRVHTHDLGSVSERRTRVCL